MATTAHSSLAGVARYAPVVAGFHLRCHRARQRPGLSNSELARGAFVTRQSMNVLLQALEREGYVTRPAEAPVGKVLPTRLTPRGRRSLEKATIAVRSVEVRMVAGMTETEQSGAFRILKSMIRSLRDGNDGA